MSNFSERVKQARKQKNLTSERLAEMVNISHTHMRRIESGNRFPSMDVIERLSTSLEILPHYLLKGEGCATLGDLEDQTLCLKLKSFSLEQNRLICSVIWVMINNYGEK